MQRRIETSPEQRLEILSKVDQLKKSEGLNLAQAWQKAGQGHLTNYYTWKRQSKKASPKKRAYRKRQIQVLQAPAPHIVAQFVLFSDGNIANLADLKRSA